MEGNDYVRSMRPDELLVPTPAGLYCPAGAFYIDPVRPVDKALITHGHADHARPGHGAVLATRETLDMMRLRCGEGFAGTTQTLGHGEKIAIDGVSIAFHPAGHVLGSAQALVEYRGQRLLYSGDLKLSSSHTAEACETPRADTLIVEATFGRPRYVFPPAVEVIAGIVSFCRNALAQGETPVLFAYSLGKGQEVLRALAGAGFDFALHGTTHGVAEVYARLGVEFPVHERLDRCDLSGRVLICPPQVKRAAIFTTIRRPRTAMVTGWAVDRAARWRYGVDAAFPLSDHADYEDLVEYVRRVNPTRVYTVFGFDGEFAADLRTRGYDAQPLKGVMQLRLV